MYTDYNGIEHTKFDLCLDDRIISNIYFMDNISFMHEISDNFFDLTVADPPYGINFIGTASKKSGTQHGSMKAKKGIYKNKSWDKIPSLKYFTEIMRISKHVIIWGANYFIDMIPGNKRSSCWLVWDKNNGVTYFADFEMAWTNFSGPSRLFKYTYNGMIVGKMKNKLPRIHPNQKPVELYDWIFWYFGFTGMKVFDPGAGSQDSRISAMKYNLKYWGCENDREYYENGCKHFLKYGLQQTINSNMTFRK